MYAQVVRLTHSILDVNTNFNWTIIINTLESLYSLEKKKRKKENKAIQGYLSLKVNNRLHLNLIESIQFLYSHSFKRR